MYKRCKKLRVLLEKQYSQITNLDQAIDVKRDRYSNIDFVHRSTNERNMTRKTRSSHIHSAFQSDYCEICHIHYTNRTEHLQSKRHLKIIGGGGENDEDGSFLTLKGFDSLLALDGIEDTLEVKCNKMPRTRTMVYDRVKESPLSPIGSESGHRLRSRKNINYMTPPLEDVSLTEKPEVVREYRELRSSTRLLAKLTEQIAEAEEVWNSGRPKRSCNRPRISADERLVVDNRAYYKVDVLPAKLRSGAAPFHSDLSNQSIEEEGRNGRKKTRNTELTRLHNEAENFLFPKKDDEDGQSTTEEEESQVAAESDVELSPESKRKKRRTHAEVFINENQKYYKFDTFSSRLRTKNNGDCGGVEESLVNLDEYTFSFESVPKKEEWFQTFTRRDTGEEFYAYLNDDNYWDSMTLPYQLPHIPPLDRAECLTQYNQLKKCLSDSLSAPASATCSTPDPTSTNSSLDPPFDDDTRSSHSSAPDDSAAPKPRRPRAAGRHPRKSPRQHASTLAILSSLIQQRNKKAAKRAAQQRLATIVEEAATAPRTPIEDVAGICRRFEEEAAMLEEPPSKHKNFVSSYGVEAELHNFCWPEERATGTIGEEFTLSGRLSVVELMELFDRAKDEPVAGARRASSRPGRKPGKRKKNRTGWPMNKNRRVLVGKRVKDGDDDSLVGEEEATTDCSFLNVTDDDANNRDSVANLISENNNKNDQSSLGDERDCEDEMEVRVDAEGGGGGGNNKSDEADKVLTAVSNGELNCGENQLEARNGQLDGKSESPRQNARRHSLPKRTNRRRMPASPKSPRMLRKPRGRWYRER